MEYVEGRQLSSLLAAGTLPLEAIVLYGAQIADTRRTLMSVGSCIAT